MSLSIAERADDSILYVKASGKLSKEDYASFAPEVDRIVEQRGKVRMLFEMDDFHGWTAGAMWEDLKFGLNHFSDIERLAVVGEKDWQKGVTQFVRPFTRAEVKYFDEDADAARQWLLAN